MTAYAQTGVTDSHCAADVVTEYTACPMAPCASHCRATACLHARHSDVVREAAASALGCLSSFYEPGQVALVRSGAATLLLAALVCHSHCNTCHSHCNTYTVLLPPWYVTRATSYSLSLVLVHAQCALVCARTHTLVCVAMCSYTHATRHAIYIYIHIYVQTHTHTHTHTHTST